jgi:hypothetical protein
MVNKEQENINDVLYISQYVRTRGVEKAKKEKKEWQNILKTQRLSPKLTRWIENLIMEKFKGV